MTDADRTEQLDADDRRVLGDLGYALARAQLFENALMRLLEAQRFDTLNQPLEERWDEILGWLTNWTAGKTAKELHLPEAIAADLGNLVKRRNEVVHRAWLNYLAAERYGKKQAADDFTVWLEKQAEYLGLAYDALMNLTKFERHRTEAEASGVELDMRGEAAVPVWRYSLPEPVPKADVPRIA